ncbi:NAC domain-containing protein 90 [Manihot esculenta]|uniref:NAC transcription factors 60 n=1 Tax=Manihot esculenta TaxID=3983 RepID=A0A0M5JCR3_MANES|nr:NAC domain-containing protein 90 [Manihot esculenta]ALC79037.1 NAC transcription factors 60 [Manihot esculenta]OAY42931.1 hypothetical protein MANES_08G027900v8 [Manihot esculenta]
MEGLAPGIRFYPTEEELVSFYLHHKLEGERDDLNRLMDRVIPVLDIYEYSPWQLPQYAGEFSHGDPEQWFFFIKRQENEARGGRPRRLTTAGYWKATGSPGYVYSSNNRCIGVKRTMVFYTGRAPLGRKTEWKMNEYKTIEGEAFSSTGANPTLRHEFSLCRVYKKSKRLRSFDRRPIGAEIGRRSAHQKIQSDEGAKARIHQNPEMVERRSSPASSSSGDHGCCFNQTGEGSSMQMAASPGDDPLWDLDQLHHWFNCLEDM